MRKKLGLFANVRPTFTFPSLIDNSPLKRERIEGTDLIILRELTGGIYFCKKETSADGNSASDDCTYSRSEIERVADLLRGAEIGHQGEHKRQHKERGLKPGSARSHQQRLMLSAMPAHER